MRYCIHNGKLVETDTISISINDLGVTRGYGLFDFFRAYGNHPLYFSDHLDRLFRGMKELGLQTNVDKSELYALIPEMLVKNNVESYSGVRILVTGGFAGGFDLSRSNMLVTQDEVSNWPDEAYEEGVTLLADNYTREMPLVKSTNYLRAVYLNREMQSQGAVDLLYHSDDIISEGSRSNFFVVSKGQLITPSQGVLEGVTRKRVLEMAREVADLRVGPIRMEELNECDEVFLSSTLKRILPVQRIIGVERTWKVGPVTRELIERLKVRDEQEIPGIWT